MHVEYLRTLIRLLRRIVNVLHKSRINDATCGAMSSGSLGCLTARVEILKYRKNPQFVNNEISLRRCFFFLRGSCDETVQGRRKGRVDL